jgi:hypothetical protein
MKKTVISILVMLFGIVAITNANIPIEPLEEKQIQEMTDQEKQLRVEVLEERVAEIEAMEMGDLKWKEKRALKKELRQIEKEINMHINDTGIYISGGALLIIILLIILL